MSTCQANIAVCGIFHYRNYVGALAKRVALQRFYYSHRLGTTAGQLGLAPACAVNVWPKEYLVNAFERFFGGSGRRWVHPRLHDLWQAGVLGRWKPCELFHLFLHGTGLKLLELARTEGAVIVGEPVNAHPVELSALLAEEHGRLGIPAHGGLSESESRLAREVGLCDWLLVGSTWLGRSFRRAGFPPDRIVRIPYAVDVTKFSPPSGNELGQRRSRFQVLSVARITPRKGHIYLLEAWKRLRLKDAELVLIGAVDPPMRPTLARYEGLFTHIERAPHDLLRDHYCSANLFVLPSIEDGFGYVCNEALACGVPVITTENTGASDMVRTDETGFVVPIRSVESIGSAIEALYRDRPRLEQMQEQAAKSIREQVTDWGQYAEKIADLYLRVTADQRHVPAPVAVLDRSR